MSELIVSRESGLPTKLEDLSKFVLIGREKLVAVRAEIRAIDKVGLAQEVRKQKLQEAQDISEAVLDAEIRIGQLMAKVPKAIKGNQYTGKMVDDSGVYNQTKTEVIESAGFTPKQVQRFETLAAHPDIVEQAKAEARANDDIVSRSSVIRMIQDNKRPHVANNSGNNEWYTPKKYIDLARKVMGTIDLDPASCEHANKTVQAKQYYSADNNGLDKEWNGKVWMNPPYSADLIQKFADKIVDEYGAGHITEAIVLVNNATETRWFSTLTELAGAVAFPTGRIRYESTTHEMNTPLQGQAFVYFGDNVDTFCDVFRTIGWVAAIR